MRGAKSNPKYVDLCKTAIASIPAQGLDIGEVTKRVNLVEKLDKVKEKEASFNIENDEYSVLVDAIKKTRWLAVSREIVDFSEYINGLKPNK